jgi:hypothetical protein
LPEVELCVEQGLASGGRGERHAATSYVTTYYSSFSLLVVVG